MKKHRYSIDLKWTGNLGKGTEAYDAYGRDYTYSTKGKVITKASADVIFRGNGELYNPEEFFLVSLSSCHMLWYLHFCADNDIIVEKYEDKPDGDLVMGKEIDGYFEVMRLNPTIHIKDINKKALAGSLHTKAHQKCFIANSVKCPIEIYPTILSM